jgi:hypothetical protein
MWTSSYWPSTYWTDSYWPSTGGVLRIINRVRLVNERFDAAAFATESTAQPQMTGEQFRQSQITGETTET